MLAILKIKRECCKTSHKTKNEKSNLDRGITTEIIIDDWTSYLRCFSPFSEERILLRFSVFFDNHCHVLSVSRVKNIMDKIRQQSLSPLADADLVPIETLFEFHALGGGKNPLPDLAFLKLDWRRVGINVIFGSFKNYRAFPQLARV